MVYQVALIGTGSFAPAHVEALRVAGDSAELVAAVNTDDSQGRAFCLEYDIPQFFPTTTAMLQTIKPDLVHICTPPHTHPDLALLCLEAGAHVLCEKPLCASLAQFDQLQAAETRAGRYLSTVFQWRFGSAAQHLKRLIESGILGKALLANCHTLWYRGEDYYAVPWRGQREKSLGGTTSGHGIHLMDLLLWLLPDWEEVQAIVATTSAAVEVDTVSLALVRFESGGFASIVNSAVSPRQETYLRLDFSAATVEVKALYSAANEDWLFTPLAQNDNHLWHVPDNLPGVLTAQVKALLHSLDKGQRPLVSGEESRRIIEFLTCLYKSGATGQPVKRGSITPDDVFYQSMVGL
jgi:predicted dehydrogenase